MLSVFVSLLAEPLSKAGMARTDADHLTIELVLHLFRNLLAVESLLGDTSNRSQQLHNDLIALLEQEMVLEIVLVLAADLEARENQPYNLMVMELVHHLIRHHDPSAVARASRDNKTQQVTRKVQAGRLKEQLTREKQSLTANSLTRHSHFGGTLVVEKNGRQQVVSAARFGEKRKALPAAAKKRKNKRMDPFVGGPKVQDEAGPSQQRAMKTLDVFCERFVRDCYGSFTKSLKNEFRRESVRVEDGDRVVFFKIILFFSQWWRVSGKNKLMPTESGGENQEAAQSTLGQLIFTMDLYTFKLVLYTMDMAQEHKRYGHLAQTVATLGELLHLLHFMYNSAESTERIMAMGLMDTLFYGSDPLDPVPKLLSRWSPGTSTRDYLCDLVEVVHITLKVLDESAELSQEAAKLTSDKNDTVEKMKARAAEFDVGIYFARRIASNNTIFMYTQLLGRYAANAAHVNHRIVALFLRLRKFKVMSSEASAEEPSFRLHHKVATLEPMLYNVQLLIVLDQILNDAGIRQQKDQSFLVSFATGLMHSFAQATKSNPVLFVEALFKHPLPHKFCDLAENMYVNEELRQIAERDLYLEEGRNLEQEEEEVRRKGDDFSDSSDEELEFEDFGITSGPFPQASRKKRPRKTRRKVKKVDKSDSDDSDNELIRSNSSTGGEAEREQKLSVVVSGDHEKATGSDEDSGNEGDELSLQSSKRPKKDSSDEDLGSFLNQRKTSEADSESEDESVIRRRQERDEKHNQLKKSLQNDHIDSDSSDDELFGSTPGGGRLLEDDESLNTSPASAKETLKDDSKQDQNDDSDASETDLGSSPSKTERVDQDEDRDD